MYPELNLSRISQYEREYTLLTDYVLGGTAAVFLLVPATEIHRVEMWASGTFTIVGYSGICIHITYRQALSIMGKDLIRLY